MSRTARRTRPVVRQWAIGERVEDRQGNTGVVAARHSRTQCLVSYDDGTQVVMYHASLTITQR